MNRIRELWFRLQLFWQRRKIESGLSEEIQSHLEMATEANIAAGMSPREARYAALREFGGVEQIKERYRDERGIRWLDELFSDIRFAARSLRKSPGFTAVAIITLALCIGANSAVFSVIHAILLKPYPWPDSERLVRFFTTERLSGRDSMGVPVPDYLDYRKGITALEECALTTTSNARFNLAAADVAPENISGLSVTPSLFPLLTARPAIGRIFSRDDAQIGATKTAILSDSLWRTQFGANPNIVDTEIRLNGQLYTVIGVMPPTFYFPTPETKLWVPLVFTDWQKTDNARSEWGYDMIARLRPGATIDLVQRQLDAIQKANAERLPQFKAAWDMSGRGGIVAGYLETEVRKIRAMLWLVQGAVSAVLLIGCTNVASLLLARASTRERELAIRAALGAGRARLMRHLLTESMLLFVTAVLLALLFASWGVTAMDNLGVGNLPRGFGVSLDFAVFGFTLACAGVAGLAFGALPAWSATRGGKVDALKDAGPHATASRRHLSLRSALVVSEIALALMLVATAALLIKSFHRVAEVNPGLARENVLIANVVLPGRSDSSLERRLERLEFQKQLLERVRALPGVTSAACTEFPPLSTGSSDHTYAYQVDGLALAADEPAPQAVVRRVSPGYFATLGTPLIRGRVFTDQDTLSTGDVVVIDKTLAERHWPGEDPIGKQLIYGFKPIPNTRIPRKWEVIGVVAPVKHTSLEAPESKATLYFSNLQNFVGIYTILVKTAGPPMQFAASLRAAVLSIDPELPLFNVTTMDAEIERSMERRRTPTILLTLFAGISLLLGAIGVYGVLAFAVGQRTKEIGVRMALGATRANILKLIFGQGVRLVVLGVVLGLSGYFALSTFIRKMLFSVEPTDYVALLLAPLCLALVALAACLLPANRATKVDPIVALRTE